MKLPDSLIISYLEVYTDVPGEQVEQIARQIVNEPMKCKLFLAHEIVKRYHGTEVADHEQQWFVETFSARNVPSDIPEVVLDAGTCLAFEVVKQCLLQNPQSGSGSQKSNREIRRLFEQGAISINAQDVKRPDEVVQVCAGDVVRVGKRSWFRLQYSPTDQLEEKS